MTALVGVRYHVPTGTMVVRGQCVVRRPSLAHARAWIAATLAPTAAERAALRDAARDVDPHADRRTPIAMEPRS